MNKELVDEIAAVSQRIKAVAKENALIFPLFSDLHVDGVTAEEAEALLCALCVIGSTMNPTAVIDLGDNLSMLGRKHHITNSQLSRILKDLFDAMRSAAGCPLFLVNGNHDAVGTDFFKPYLWNSIVHDQYDDKKAVKEQDSSYYYVDYEQADLRMVFLSVPYESDLSAVHPTPLWAFGPTQLEWLKHDALNTDRSVLLFSHVPFFYCYRGDKTRIYEVWDGDNIKTTYVDALCGWIDDAREAAAIVAERGNVLACFSGHTHEDSLWEPYQRRGEDENYLPCRQVVTTHAAHHQNAVGVAVDILVWNPNEKKVHLIRFGQGEDRQIV